MIQTNQKEKFVFRVFKELIESDSFDEIDINSFLIYIRSLFEKNDPNTYQYLCDICDFVAHRKRDKGKTADGIKRAIANNYKTVNGSNEVEGFSGIKYNVWKIEWEKLGIELGINFSEAIIKNISICVLSMLQDTVFFMDKHNQTQIAVLKILQGRKCLSLGSTEGTQNSPYVMYFKVEDISFQKRYPTCEINDPLFAKRINGELHLINELNEIIV